MELAVAVKLALAVAGTILVAGVAAQGRGRHLVLMMLGAVPRRVPGQLESAVPTHDVEPT